MKCNATVAVVGKIMAYESCGIPKILMKCVSWQKKVLRLNVFPNKSIKKVLTEYFA